MVEKEKIKIIDFNGIVDKFAISRVINMNNEHLEIHQLALIDFDVYNVINFLDLAIWRPVPAPMNKSVQHIVLFCPFQNS